MFASHHPAGVTIHLWIIIEKLGVPHPAAAGRVGLCAITPRVCSVPELTRGVAASIPNAGRAQKLFATAGIRFNE